MTESGSGAHPGGHRADHRRGLVIGLALGVSGAIVPAVSGWIIDTEARR